MRVRKIGLGLGVGLAMVGTAAVGMAQEDRGRINGLVTDTSGAVVPKAKVTVTNEGTGVSSTKATDSSGAYVFEYLNPGLYTVKVDESGFKSYVTTHVRVETAAHVGVNAKLEVGGDRPDGDGGGNGWSAVEDGRLGAELYG